MTANVVDGLEHVDLARELEGVAVAAVGMQDDRVGRRELPALVPMLVEEVDLAQVLASPVEPDVETGRSCPASLLGFGNDQAVRLHRAVDTRNVSTHNEAGL